MSRCTTARTFASASWAAISIPPTGWRPWSLWKRPTAAGEVLTGVLYLNPTKPTFLDLLDLGDAPLGTLPESKTRPSQAALDEIMEELR